MSRLRVAIDLLRILILIGLMAAVAFYWIIGDTDRATVLLLMGITLQLDELYRAVKR